jgi:tetratricopeptide (TPR) repeat protein
MPTTVNGIGTHYYGKKDHSVRTGICGSCRRTGDLQSYETRLWFVVVFIPVIPLGRKRIIDECPSCRKHMVANADAYEQARQLQTSASLDRYRREPSPEAALEAHAQLLSFREYEQAAEFRSAALERFPDEVVLRTVLAAHLEQVLVYDESAALYAEALELQPDMPDARVGVARRKMVQGELDEARQLLDFLEVPGAGQHYALGPIDVLSTYFQQKGRHEEALELSEHLLREIPTAGQLAGFRTFVQKSEKALGRRESILPPRKHSVRGLFRSEGSPYSSGQRKFALVGIGLVLLVGGLMFNNNYIRGHRTIQVVNAIGQPVHVQVDDGPPQAINGERGQIVVPEGHHRLKLTGAVDETHEVDLNASYFERWTSKPLWVLNPGGEAVFEEDTLYYAKQPQPGHQRLIVGEPFITIAHVDYPFETPPNSISVKGQNTEIVKTGFQRIQGQDVIAFLETIETDRPRALTFIENRMRHSSASDELLKTYLKNKKNEENPRIEAFLKTGLERRPVSVQWHRAYQSFAQLNGRDKELIALYDRYLTAEPKSGALLYLRGRIEPDWTRKGELFNKAAEADPRLAWPWMGLAVRAASSAQWDEALRYMRKAQELKIDEDQVADWVHVVRLAVKDDKALINDYRTRLAANPIAPKTILSLCDALAATGKPGEIEPELTAWEGKLPMTHRPHLAPLVRAFTLYQAGNFKECDQSCRAIPMFLNSSLRAQALLALGKAQEVADDPGFKESFEDPWLALSVGLAFDLDRRTDEAAKWRDRAIKQLETHAPESREAAKALRSPDPVPMADLDRLVVNPDDKALLYAVLARRFPAKRAEYNAGAARFNLSAQPPYHLVRRAIAAPAPALP